VDWNYRCAAIAEASLESTPMAVRITNGELPFSHSPQALAWGSLRYAA